MEEEAQFAPGLRGVSDGAALLQATPESATRLLSKVPGSQETTSLSPLP
jgi:hypothetical protein